MTTFFEQQRKELKIAPKAWKRVADLLTPAEKSTADVWGNKNRIYPLSAGRPGPRDPNLTPYIIDFERFFDDPRYETGVFVCGTQMSKTDGILDVMGWRLDTRPRPQLYVGPSKDFVTEQFEPRLMALFDESQRLRDRVARGKRNKKFKKTVNGVGVRLAWAGSPTSLSSDQAGDIYIDEYSKMFRTKAKGGDPYVLAKARADSYADRKIAVTSTPEDGTVTTEKDPASGLEFWAVADPEKVSCATWKRWQTGTRHHLAWQCPHCSEWFIPRYRDLRWPEGATPGMARRSTYLCCPTNGCVIAETEKEAMNANKRFVAPGQFIRPDGSIGGDPEDSTTISWWASGLASPFLSWGERVEEILNAKLTGDPSAEKAAINKVGELWSEQPVMAVTEDDLKANVQPGFRIGMVPPAVICVTVGADVQKNRIVYAVRGWGAQARSWLLDRGQIFGLTSQTEVWSRFSVFLQRTYGGLPPAVCMIDSGFRPDKKEAGDYHRVYDFCRKEFGLAFPTKGQAKQTLPLIKRQIEVTAEGDKAKFGIELFHVHTDHFKREWFSRLFRPPGDPGSVVLPEDVGSGEDDYLKQIVSEVRSEDGTWHKVYPHNHYLDAEVLAGVGGFLFDVSTIPEGTVRSGASTEIFDPTRLANVTHSQSAAPSIRERFAARSAALHRK